MVMKMGSAKSWVFSSVAPSDLHAPIILGRACPF